MDAQNRKTDSLKKALFSTKNDTDRINIFFYLANEMNVVGELDSSISYSNKALRLIGTAKHRDKILESNLFLELGHSYRNKSDHPVALANYLKAIKIKETFNDEAGILRCFCNIGLIHNSEGDFQKGLNYLFVAKKMAEKLKDKYIVGVVEGNIGNNYWLQGKDSLALDCYFKALKVMQELKDMKHVAINTNNIASIYAVTKEYEKAQEYFFKALQLNEELEFKLESEIITGNIGSTYTKLKKYKEAEFYILKAIEQSTLLGDIEGIKENNFNLHELYSIIGKHDLAFIHYKKFITARDSISNEENTRQLTRTEMQYDFDKKESEAKAEQEKKDVVTRIIIYSISGGLFLVFLLALFIFRSNRQKQKANAIIILQKEEVEKQKHLVEEKQKEILDSIHYARKIQTSLLPTEKYIEKQLIKRIS